MYLFFGGAGLGQNVTPPRRHDAEDTGDAHEELGDRRALRPGRRKI